MEVQGWVVIALTLLLLGYLLPHVVHSRQLLLDSRAEDRFSANLRILATAGTGGTRAVAGGAHHRGVVARPHLHQRRPEAPAVKRPTTRSARAEQDARALAAARAARAAEISRRAAAARRRLILTVALLVLTVAAWAGVGLAGMAWALAAVPSALLVTTLVAGRRAAVRAQARDAAARADMARLEQRLLAVSGREVPASSGARQRPARAGRSVTAGHGSAAGSRSTGARTEAPATAAGSAGNEATASDHPTESSERDAPGEPEPTGDPAAPVADGAADGAEDRPGAAPAADGAEETTGHRTTAAGHPTPAGTAQERGTTGAAESADGVPGKDATRGAAGTSHATHPAPEKPAVEPWTPVPVPLPTYTLKPAAPRMAVAPYEAAPGTADVTVPARPTQASPAPQRVAVEEPSVAVTLDLEEVLARRRAAGE